MPASTPSYVPATGAPIRQLHGHGERSPAHMLDEAAAFCRQTGASFDLYGHGPLLADFEAKIATLLGFEAGRFMPSGVMAQLCALRVYAERSGRRHFGMHPTSHLEIHEERAYAHLHGLAATLIGPARGVMTAADLAGVVEPLGVVVTELPVREAGGMLPTWDELRELKQLAASRGTPLHLDGARLWECGPAYDRPYSEICEGFSSVYVSFYKGIGALSGAMLLGDADFIAEAALWQRRQGGTLWSQAPSVASAAARFDAALQQMPAYVSHAASIAAALAELPGVRIVPSHPRTNLFHVVADGDPQTVVVARDAAAAERGIMPFRTPQPGPVPGSWKVELYIGDAALKVTVDEAADVWRDVLDRLRG